jgi:anti-sigma factor ChrR (cupin superfamily)
MQAVQVFRPRSSVQWVSLDVLPGVELQPLAEPLPGGSIHRALLKSGTTIPAHTHPADEYVLVLSGRIQTGEVVCEAGTFWSTPAGVRQGPHVAIDGDVELLTMRLGPMGAFETR